MWFEKKSKQNNRTEFLGSDKDKTEELTKNDSELKGFADQYDCQLEAAVAGTILKMLVKTGAAVGKHLSISYG